MSRHHAWGLSLVLAAAVCAAAQQQQQRAELSRVTPLPEQDAAAWERFTPVGGGFSVSMPGKPAEEKDPVETAVGRLQNRLFSLETPLALYLVAYADFPQEVTDPATVQKMLDGGRDQALANVKGKLVGEEDIRLSTHAGRAWVIETPGGGRMQVRAYWAGRRLYQALFATPGPRPGSPELETLRSFAAEKFFGSFELAREVVAR